MFYDYKVIPAPKQIKPVKGLKSTSDLFAAMLSEVINTASREGWEYVRAETLSAAEGGGWFRRGHEVVETVLIFRRSREMISPRLSAGRPEPAAEPEAAPRAIERPSPDRLQATPLRREPRLADDNDNEPRPARPQMPRLGPADQI